MFQSIHEYKSNQENDGLLTRNKNVDRKHKPKVFGDVKNTIQEKSGNRTTKKRSPFGKKSASQNKISSSTLLEPAVLKYDEEIEQEKSSNGTTKIISPFGKKSINKKKISSSTSREAAAIRFDEDIEEDPFEKFWSAPHKCTQNIEDPYSSIFNFSDTEINRILFPKFHDPEIPIIIEEKIDEIDIGTNTSDDEIPNFSSVFNHSVCYELKADDDELPDFPSLFIHSESFELNTSDNELSNFSW